MWESFGFLAGAVIFAAALFAWGVYMECKMGKLRIRKQLNYKVYCQGQQRPLKEGTVPVNKQGISFGYRKERNVVSFERILAADEEEGRISEAAREEIRKYKYRSWFQVVQKNGQLYIEPAYSDGERGTGKKVSIQRWESDSRTAGQEILKDGGELLKSGMAVLSDPEEDPLWKIEVYEVTERTDS